ncbi:MAG: DNA-binding protein [Thermodesulfobacteriota bacterium]|nr:DNA-binding protein [Thermodesulfobacteriota bacterium]
MDEELLTRRFEIESKVFFLDLKKNPGGLYLKITEKSGDKRNFIIIPERGIEEFYSELGKFVEEKKELR